MIYDRWFNALGFKPANTLTSNSIVALLALTVSGLGISYFPRRCLQPLIAAGLLDVLDIDPGLPDIPYAAMYKAEGPSELTASVILLAQTCCDFSNLIQLPLASACPVPGVVIGSA